VKILIALGNDIVKSVENVLPLMSEKPLSSFYSKLKKSQQAGVKLLACGECRKCEI